ncbi:MAG: hypothetical protein PVG86_04510 [Desulfobacterales bacterium]
MTDPAKVRAVNQRHPLSRSDNRWLVLTGDCLFVGDSGRPDLAGGMKAWINADYPMVTA